MKAKPVKTIDSYGNEKLYPSIGALCRSLNISVTTAGKYRKSGRPLQYDNSLIRIVNDDQK